MGAPEVLLLDEVERGLDAEGRAALAARLGAHHIVGSQQFHLVERQQRLRQEAEDRRALDDPSLAAGDEDAKRRAFELTRQALGYRFLQLLALPLERLSPAALAAAATAINHS